MEELDRYQRAERQEVRATILKGAFDMLNTINEVIGTHGVNIKDFWDNWVIASPFSGRRFPAPVWFVTLWSEWIWWEYTQHEDPTLIGMTFALMRSPLQVRIERFIPIKEESIKALTLIIKKIREIQSQTVAEIRRVFP